MPGLEAEMNPPPEVQPRHPYNYPRLQGKTALITGGDSGIGRAVALAFAAEGADVTIIYLNEDKDAAETARLVEKHGQACLTIAADVGSEKACKDAVTKAIERFGKLDVLVNNAAEQHPQKDIEDINQPFAHMPALDELCHALRVNVPEAERFFSVAAGVTALMVGGWKKSLGGILLATGGLFLLQRGMNGHCVLYSALELPPVARRENRPGGK